MPFVIFLEENGVFLALIARIRETSKLLCFFECRLREDQSQRIHSILVLRIIRRTGVLSCVLFEILSLSCVLLSCLLSHGIAYYSQIVTLVLRIICDSDLVLPIVVLPIPEGSRILWVNGHLIHVRRTGSN